MLKNNIIFIFPTQFCLWSKSNKIAAGKSRKACFKGNVYDISVDYNAIYKSDILNIP